jgi:hypothetical protein
LVGLPVAGLGNRQLAQVEIGRQESLDEAVFSADRLRRGQRWASGIATDVGMRQRKKPAGQRVSQVGAVCAISPAMVTEEVVTRRVRADLAELIVEHVEILAVGNLEDVSHALRKETSWHGGPAGLLHRLEQPDVCAEKLDEGGRDH